MTWYPYIAPVPPDVVWSGSVALTVPVVAGLLGCALLVVFALRAHLHAAVGASVLQRSRGLTHLRSRDLTQSEFSISAVM